MGREEGEWNREAGSGESSAGRMGTLAGALMSESWLSSSAKRVSFEVCTGEGSATGEAGSWVAYESRERIADLMCSDALTVD